ncbi:MAG: hypothetical protein V4717_13855 [Bacteroidota bacterium]
MRQFKSALLYILLFSLHGTSTHAQFNESVKQQLVKEWQRAKDYTLEYLETMPKEDYGFKAEDSIRGFEENAEPGTRLLHHGFLWSWQGKNLTGSILGANYCLHSVIEYQTSLREIILNFTSFRKNMKLLHH